MKKGSKKLKETSRVLDHTFESGDFVVGGKDKKSIPWIIGGGDFKMKMKLSGKEGQTYECYEVHFKVK